MNNNFKIKDIVIISIFTAVLFVQEQALSFLPNIQLTVLLLVLYSKILGFNKTVIIVLLHVLLDSILGGFNILYLIPMLIGWMSIPIMISTLFKKVESSIGLGIVGIIASVIYSWSFIFIEVVVLKGSFTAYFIADLPFELLLMGSSFLSIIWLYQPLYKLINKIYQ